MASWLLALGCASPVLAVEPPKAVVVTERDADREVTIAPGATLIVRLGTRLGTGYGWQIAENDSSRLRAAGPPELEGSSSEPGAAQRQVFRFIAQKAGSTSLAFRYVRPWEPEEVSARTFRIDVRIQ